MFDPDFEFDSTEIIDRREIEDSAELSVDLNGIVSSVRTIVKLFKNSPKLNGYLQENVIESIGHSLQLKLDMKTRWNSLLTMLQSFERIKQPIKKTLKDINHIELWRDSFEFESFSDVINVLQVVKETMDVISKESADLLDAEGAFECLFEELKSTDGSFSHNLLSSLQDEIKKRRNKNLVSLMKFLQNPDSLKGPIDNFFNMNSMKDIIKEASKIWKDFFSVDTPAEEAGQEVEVVPGQSALTFREKLGKKIGSRKETATQIVDHGNRFIKTACETYAATKAMPECLKKIQEALLVIKPTSIRNEENFSASSNFLTDKRTRLTCRSLDDYCFLKSYYIQKRML